MAPPTSPSLPSTMKAWTYNRRGWPTETLRLSTIPTPQPSQLKPDEVLVRISHVAFNLGIIVAFTLFPHFTSAPCVPEIEFSGTIVAVGSSVDEFSAGQEVIGMRNITDMVWRGGALTEYVASSKDSVALKPANMTMAEACGIPGVGITSLQSLELAHVKKGDKVLVTGGSSGLGSMLCQVLRDVVGESGTIVATCSGKNAEWVKSLGVDEVIDYTKHEKLYVHVKEEHGKQPFNAIFDVVDDPALYQNCPSFLTVDGSYILLGAMGQLDNPSWWSLGTWLIAAKLERFRPVILGGIPRDFRMYNAIPNKKDLEGVVKLAVDGKIKGLVDSVWSMGDALKAYEKQLTKRARGKIVIEVQAPS